MKTFAGLRQSLPLKSRKPLVPSRVSPRHLFEWLISWRKPQGHWTASTANSKSPANCQPHESAVAHLADSNACSAALKVGLQRMQERLSKISSCTLQLS